MKRRSRVILKERLSRLRLSRFGSSRVRFQATGIEINKTSDKNQVVKTHLGNYQTSSVIHAGANILEISGLYDNICRFRSPETDNIDSINSVSPRRSTVINGVIFLSDRQVLRNRLESNCLRSPHNFNA